ncbi:MULTISPECIES: ThuA domain-containing protein [Streptosporangium]|uniref:Glucose/arabinose dehydrogenase/type 1 glutamine amidotransferase/PKD repeat protein n=1 Tax=Streptosporangium brasiliense TaxID=47480 RepID=A0ABT9R7V0_9ACTN|nr:ThuA domain-containing protein [Streptosporangium brasiliense]MDP9865314.1 glucose/arabinose dehydrogenase/type 1 glutamine amidotransferase/PKD repeat protein [Streptosporangium brasiliense]
MRRPFIALLVPILLLLSAGTAHARAVQAPAFRALLFTETAGYVHDSIPAGTTMVQQLASADNFEVVQSADSAVFNDAALATYDVVIMLQNSGMVWDNDAQRQAVQKYVNNGGGIVAIHNTTDMNVEAQFPWWDQLILGGAHMTAHSSILQGTAKVADRVHPSTAGLPERWTRTEEWYNFDKNLRGDVHVLVTADETTYDAGPSKMGADHPISWCRSAEGGRVWATGMGHQIASYSEPQFRQHVLGGIKWAAGNVQGDCGGTVWNRFQKVTLDSAPDQPMQLDIAADGHVYYITRTGKLVAIHEDGEIVVTGTLNVYTGGEDGLIGMVLDPGFATNHWVYLNYSPAGSAAVNQVSRFTLNDHTLDLSSEKKLLTIPATRTDEPGHTGGQLAFGPGGNLYIGVGDDINPFASDGYAPIDERAGRQNFDAQRSSANTNDLRGKILRIHPESDGTYTVPSGNMFPAGTAQTRPEIYAMGFRNPFRFAVDPETGWISMADYGPDAGAANANRGPEGTVEWNLIKSPGFYGWPYCVGNNTPYNDYDFATSTSGAKFNCAAPVNNSPNNTGLTNLPAAKAATVWYTYHLTPEWPEMGDSGGAAPMGGPFYHYDEANPSTTKFPAYFDKTPFFYEWSRNYLAEMRLDGGGNVLKVNRFLSNLGFRSPMHMKFGPDGSMYLIEWGAGYGGSNPDDGVYRIDYVSGSRSPVAKASGTPTSGKAPLQVQFSSAGSADPDGDPFTYAWDFTGDGTTDSTAAGPSFTYTANGTFTAKLTITDSSGKSGSATVPITVGNTAPVVTFGSPPNGGVISFGDSVGYTVTVTDPEDGTIDCSKVVVVTALGHDTHSHDTGQFTGCSGTVSTTASGHDADANTYYVLTATYTDKGGLAASANLILQPRQKQAEYFTGSSGVRVVEQAGAQNGKRVGDISNNDWISFSPMSVQGITSVAYRVSSPYGGGTIELRADSPTGQLLSTTAVPNTGGWDTYQSLTATPVAALSGSHPLFLVFKHPTANQFDLDSFTLNGAGVGAPGGPVADAVYTLTAAHSSKVADVEGQSTADGAKVVQWGGNGGTNQQWKAVDRGNGNFALFSVKSGKCLDVNAGSTAAGALIIQWTCHTAANQQWKFAPAANGNWKITSVGSGHCLEVPGATTADGTQLTQGTCGTGTNQQWKLTRVS